MNVLDLFSGIGGFSLGLERAGMRTVAFCEIEPHARAVLNKHWPDVPCHDDITSRQFTPGEADIVCGGFPCQDISLAGDGAGLAGERSGLWRELLRAIRVVRPRYAIVENVAALLSRGMGTVLGDMAEVGYDAEWHCIPASAVGAPHRRDRVWIVANAGSEQHEGGSPPISGEIAAELLAANAIGDDGGSRRPGRSDPSCEGQPEPVRSFQDMAHPKSERRDGSGSGTEPTGRREFADGSQDVADAECIGQPGPWQPVYASNQTPGGERQADHALHVGIGSIWATEPDVGRVAHGVPARVDRLKGLGNAVVPQIPEIIGRAIMRASTVNSQHRGGEAS